MRVIGPEEKIWSFGQSGKRWSKRRKEFRLDRNIPLAQPPVAKIMDLGKYLYNNPAKKQKDAAKKAHETGVKESK